MRARTQACQACQMRPASRAGWISARLMEACQLPPTPLWVTWASRYDIPIYNGPPPSNPLCQRLRAPGPQKGETCRLHERHLHSPHAPRRFGLREPLPIDQIFYNLWRHLRTESIEIPSGTFSPSCRQYSYLGSHGCSTPPSKHQVLPDFSSAYSSVRILRLRRLLRRA